jgi:cephalosporin hydroxylase
MRAIKVSREPGKIFMNKLLKQNMPIVFWLGVPIIQLPPDLQTMQEVIWKVKPDLVIETGIAVGRFYYF